MGRKFRKTMTLTITAAGAGDEWGSVDLFPVDFRGKVTMITVRRDAADDDGTPADLFLVTNGDTLTDEPSVNDLVVKASGVVLSQSATAASLQSGLDYPPVFAAGLRLGAKVTFAGVGDSVTHWTVEGELD